MTSSFLLISISPLSSLNRACSCNAASASPLSVNPQLHNILIHQNLPSYAASASPFSVHPHLLNILLVHQNLPSYGVSARPHLRYHASSTADRSPIYNRCSRPGFPARHRHPYRPGGPLVRGQSYDGHDGHITIRRILGRHPGNLDIPYIYHTLTAVAGLLLRWAHHHALTGSLRLAFAWWNVGHRSLRSPPLGLLDSPTLLEGHPLVHTVTSAASNHPYGRLRLVLSTGSPASTDDRTGAYSRSA